MTGRIHLGVAIAALLATTSTAALADRGFCGGEGRGRMMLEMFDTIDANKDGNITEAEFEAHRTAEFTAADTNGDGMLSSDELAQQHLARMSAKAAERSARMIENLDDNGDGSLSLDEMYQTVRERGFARMDRDDDGTISKDEAEGAMERFAEGRRHHRRGMGGGMGEGMGDGMDN